MPIERKLAAIMIMDIARYTALSVKDEKKNLELLDKQKQKNDNTVILAGYTKSLMRDNYGYKPK